MMSDIKDLPELTPKQMKFVEGVLSGLTASDAYRGAYGCENTPPEQIWVRASETRSNSKVQLWLQAARQHNLSKHAVTLESHLSELDRLKAEAEKTGAIGAAVKAVELQGRVSGLYVERHRNEDARSDGELLAEIRALSPDAADALERDLGLKGSLTDNSSGDSKLTH